MNDKKTKKILFKKIKYGKNSLLAYARKWLIWWFIWVFLIICIGFLIYYLIHSNQKTALFIFLGTWYFINFILSVVLILQKRNLKTKISYFVIANILPIIGFIFFVIFARRYRRRKIHYEYWQNASFKYEKRNKKVNFKGISKTTISILEKQSSISQRGIAAGNFQIFDDGITGFKKIFEDLRKAKNFIHIEFYIIKPGEIFEELRHILLQKAKEGVQIRMLVDDLGSWAMPRKVIKELLKNNINIKFFNKVPFPLLSSQNVVTLHRKLIIIDGKIAYSGGVNIADEYSWINKNYGIWLDTMFKIEGESVRSLSLMFLDDWRQTTSEILEYADFLQEKKNIPSNSYSVLVEDTPEIMDPIFNFSLMQWILNAKKTIVIATPYFIPSIEIFEALKISALSGVDISIIVPGKADKSYVLVGTKYYAKELQKYGVKFFETKDIFVHSKMGLFDNEYGYLGTSNLDMRSFYHQLENTFLVAGDITKKIDLLLKKYINMSVKIKIPEKYDKWFHDKLIRFFVNFFTPIL